VFAIVIPFQSIEIGVNAFEDLCRFALAKLAFEPFNGVFIRLILIAAFDCALSGVAKWD
jgi:hypothetical protein